MISINNTLDGYLKNVEIKGNTIQNETDLADIKSVGDKVEGQELYKIPLLSVGKNLFDGELQLGALNVDGTVSVNNDRCVSKNFINISGGNTLFLSNSLGYSISRSAVYDKNKNFISIVSNGVQVPLNACYYKFCLVGNNLSNNIQLEEGTQATPYEPYKEHKLTILSPVQLEKVGTVQDIVYENGDIDKNIQTVYYKDLINIAGVSSNANYWFATGSHPSIKPGAYNTSGSNVISNIKFSHSFEESEHVWYDPTSNTFRIALSKTTFPTFDRDAFVKYFTEKNIFMKVQVSSPVNYKLPHAQQVKLRTFANKTNISFLTEIEGTIKASVPKSISATVNVHTEEINSLNKELD
ncbi:MAG: hypothetical protein ACRDD7_15720, partial [Peptostreptococcaceae bacterium]